MAKFLNHLKESGVSLYMYPLSLHGRRTRRPRPSWGFRAHLGMMSQRAGDARTFRVETERVVSLFGWVSRTDP